MMEAHLKWLRPKLEHLPKHEVWLSTRESNS